MVYSKETSIPDISVRAVESDEKSLLFVDDNDDREAIYTMSLLDGAVSTPIFSEGTDIDDLLLDINRNLKAVIHSGFKPKYDFVNPEFDSLFERLEHTFPNSSIRLESWAKDRRVIIIFVSGGDEANTYYLYDVEKGALEHLGSQYDVKSIGGVKAIRYKARDGLKIAALLTLPPFGEKKGLPLIALPHGGPEAYDQISFDWMAQFFAAKGYAVLQPNFRGSTGFGYDFRNAGRGRWGREMQDDVTDGIKVLVNAGYVDPSRVCILGASYGGYSALAGGAFSPDLYRCVVSVNGVSDLPKMLVSTKHKYGHNHWVVNYWRELIGDSKKEIEKLRNISPANFSDNFQAPVLLIHGEDDTVVSIKQSEAMYKALKKSNKKVELVVLDGEDHWLSVSSTRLKMLAVVSDFLDEYNPAVITGGEGI